MSVLQQVYCTHCTYGSSALERRGGAAASQVLGYSARASSYEQAELKAVYRAVEYLLQYSLPSDVPAAERQLRTPQDSPRRLVFVPVVAGYRVAGQIVHRPQDCAGRPGSYFAHLLVGRPDDPAWDLLTALRLWKAPGWTLSDPPGENDWQLPTTDAGRVEGAVPPAIGDPALAYFLFGTPGFDISRTCDPGLLPPRWTARPAPERRTFFEDAFCGYLDARRRNVPFLLVVEPSIAALTFYGIARLLPPALRHTLSVSTYEPACDQLTTDLSATCFDQGDKAGDVPADRYERWYVINTYPHRERKSELTAGRSQYVGQMVELFQERGSSSRALDDLLGRISPDGADGVERLEAWAERHSRLRTVCRKLIDGVAVTDAEWRGVAGDAVRDRILPALETAARDDATGQVRRLLLAPRNILLLARLLPLPADPSNPLLRQILIPAALGLPDAEWARLAGDAAIPVAARRFYLRELLERRQRWPALPPGFWSSEVAAGLLDKLPLKTVELLWKQLSVTPPSGTAVGRPTPAGESGAFLLRVLDLPASTDGDPHDLVPGMLDSPSQDAALLLCTIAGWLGRANGPVARGALLAELPRRFLELWRHLPDSNRFAIHLNALRVATECGLISLPAEQLKTWSNIDYFLKSHTQAAAPPPPKPSWSSRNKPAESANFELTRLAGELAQQFHSLSKDIHPQLASATAVWECAQRLAIAYERRSWLVPEFKQAFQQRWRQLNPRPESPAPPIVPPPPAPPAAQAGPPPSPARTYPPSPTAASSGAGSGNQGRPTVAGRHEAGTSWTNTASAARSLTRAPIPWWLAVSLTLATVVSLPGLMLTVAAWWGHAGARQFLTRGASNSQPRWLLLTSDPRLKVTSPLTVQSPREKLNAKDLGAASQRTVVAEVTVPEGAQPDTGCRIEVLDLESLSAGIQGCNPAVELVEIRGVDGIVVSMQSTASSGKTASATRSIPLLTLYVQSTSASTAQLEALWSSLEQVNLTRKAPICFQNAQRQLEQLVVGVQIGDAPPLYVRLGTADSAAKKRPPERAAASPREPAAPTTAQPKRPTAAPDASPAANPPAAAPGAQPPATVSPTPPSPPARSAPPAAATAPKDEPLILKKGGGKQRDL